RRERHQQQRWQRPAWHKHILDQEGEVLARGHGLSQRDVENAADSQVLLGAKPYQNDRNSARTRPWRVNLGAYDSVKKACRFRSSSIAAETAARLSSSRAGSGRNHRD